MAANYHGYSKDYFYLDLLIDLLITPLYETLADLLIVPLYEALAIKRLLETSR